MFEWDEKKRAANLKKHGVDFEFVWELDWKHSVTRHDARFDYGEERFVAFLSAGERLYCCAYTDRNSIRRIISLRKANQKEVYWYETQAFD